MVIATWSARESCGFDPTFGAAAGAVVAFRPAAVQPGTPGRDIYSRAAASASSPNWPRMAGSRLGGLFGQATVALSGHGDSPSAGRPAPKRGRGR
jgi:hypothetical protein